MCASIQNLQLCRHEVCPLVEIGIILSVGQEEEMGVLLFNSRFLLTVSASLTMKDKLFHKPWPFPNQVFLFSYT